MLEQINDLDRKPLEEAREIAISIVEKRKANTINQKTAKAQVLRDLQAAPTSAEVSRIMWQQYLASEGLRTSGSAWANKYKNI